MNYTFAGSAFCTERHFFLIIQIHGTIDNYEILIRMLLSVLNRSIVDHGYKGNPVALWFISYNW